MRKNPANAILSDETARMLREVRRKNPFLSEKDEKELFLAWRDHGDVKAGDRLVLSHLPLALAMARKQGGYGLCIDDVLGYAQLGLVRALEKFDLTRGVRFGTFALWLVKEDMSGYILTGTSMTKGANTAASRLLFFNLRRIKGQLGIYGLLTEAEAVRVREELSLKSTIAMSIELRAIMDTDEFLLSNTMSLDTPAREDEDGSMSLGDILPDGAMLVDEVVSEQDEQDNRLSMLRRAVADALKNERERHIFIARKLTEPPLTLEALSASYGISRERVRQVESRALDRVAKRVLDLQEQARNVFTRQGGDMREMSMAL